MEFQLIPFEASPFASMSPAPSCILQATQMRCALQADFLKLLYDKLTELHMRHADTSDEWKYPLPSFKASPVVTPTYNFSSNAMKALRNYKTPSPERL